MVSTDATDPISSKCKRNKIENEEKFVLSTYSLTKLLNEDYETSNYGPYSSGHFLVNKACSILFL